MDDEVVQRVLQEGGREFLRQSPSTSSSSSSSSILQSLPLHVSFDHGYYLLVKSVQELREKKGGVVTVGIGGPSGSSKSRRFLSGQDLAEKVASVIGCIVVSMENYRNEIDDANGLDAIDFDALVRNLEVGGVHFSLLSKIRINNSFVSSFREAIYKLKCRSESSGGSSYAFQGTERQIDNSDDEI